MTDNYIDRRTYLAGLGAAGLAGLAGCSRGGFGTATGTLATAVTDQPGDIADFESCVVTIVGIWLGPAADQSSDDSENTTEDGGETDESSDDETAEEGESEEDSREYYEFGEPQEADLVELQGDNTALVDEREIPADEYSYLQLDTDGVEATLTGGASATVEVPGNAPLKFNEAFEIRADTRTTFTADFTPVKRGRSGSYNLQPVARGVTVEYEEIEDESSGNETEQNETTS